MVKEKIMVQEFIDQNYIIIENNVVTNLVVWNGDTSQWTPPPNSIALVQATTPSLIWTLDISLIPPAYVLTEELGVGSPGFTWDGSILTTNEPQPQPPKPAQDQPITSGTTTI